MDTYENEQLDEASQLCESAVELDPGSANAQLALGAIRLMLYLRECFELPYLDDIRVADLETEAKAYMKHAETRN